MSYVIANKNTGAIRKIVDQFRTFMKTYHSGDVRSDKTANSASGGTLIIGPKIQGFKERYKIRYKIDFDHQHHDQDCIPFLDKYIQPHSAYVFIKSTNGYTPVTGECELREGEQFVLCYRKGSEFTIDSLLAEYVSPEWKQACKSIELLENSNYAFKKCNGIPVDWSILNVSKGKIVAGKKRTCLKVLLRLMVRI